MYIIPFYTIYKESKNPLTIAVTFMCKNGREFWKSDGNETVEEIVREYLEGNGFIGKIKEKKDDMLFYEIDKSKTSMNDFYMWLDEGVKEDSDVWRPWFFLEDNEQETNKILSVLRGIVLKK